METLLKPISDSVAAISRDGVPVHIQIDPLTALLLALALIAPVVVWGIIKN